MGSPGKCKYKEFPDDTHSITGILQYFSWCPSSLLLTHNAVRQAAAENISILSESLILWKNVRRMDQVVSDQTIINRNIYKYLYVNRQNMYSQRHFNCQFCFCGSCEHKLLIRFWFNLIYSIWLSNIFNK